MAQVFEFCQIENNDCNVISVISDDTLDKGYVCSISGIATGYTDVYEVAAPQGATTGATPTEADLVLICGDEDYIDSTTGQKTGGVKDPRDISWATGTILTAQRLPVGGRIKLDQDSIVTDDADPAVDIAADVYLIPRDDAYTLATSSTIPSGVGFVLIIEREPSFDIGGEYVDAVIARRVV